MEDNVIIKTNTPTTGLILEHKTATKLLNMYEKQADAALKDDSIDKVDYSNIITTRNCYRKLEKVLRIRLHNIGIHYNKGNYSVSFAPNEHIDLTPTDNNHEEKNPDNNDK